VLNDPAQRKNFRGAMDFLQAKRRTQFPDHDELRGTAQRWVRPYPPLQPGTPATLAGATGSRLTANGVQVHWAQTPDDANAIALGIAQRVNARHIIKGKSMVSEEIGFNHAMEAAGIEAWSQTWASTSCSWRVRAQPHHHAGHPQDQAGDCPTVCRRGARGAYTEDVDALIQIGRRVLRRKFADADIGLSGVNVAVAETGTLCLVENEGNGRMCTTVPKGAHCHHRH
jgi:L-lactate dehydrogenase complex protein LldF